MLILLEIARANSNEQNMETKLGRLRWWQIGSYEMSK